MSDMPDRARGGSSCIEGGLGVIEAPRSSRGCKRTDGLRLRLERLGGGMSESSTAHSAKGRVERARLGVLPSAAASGCDWGKVRAGPMLLSTTLRLSSYPFRAWGASCPFWAWGASCPFWAWGVSCPFWASGASARKSMFANSAARGILGAFNVSPGSSGGMSDNKTSVRTGPRGPLSTAGRVMKDHRGTNPLDRGL